LGGSQLISKNLKEASFTEVNLSNLNFNNVSEDLNKALDKKPSSKSKLSTSDIISVNSCSDNKSNRTVIQIDNPNISNIKTLVSSNGGTESNLKALNEYNKKISIFKNLLVLENEHKEIYIKTKELLGIDLSSINEIKGFTNLKISNSISFKIKNSKENNSKSKYCSINTISINIINNEIKENKKKQLQLFIDDNQDSFSYNDQYSFRKIAENNKINDEKINKNGIKRLDFLFNKFQILKQINNET